MVVVVVVVVVRGEEREGEGDESVGEVGQIRVSLFRVCLRG